MRFRIFNKRSSVQLVNSHIFCQQLAFLLTKMSLSVTTPTVLLLWISILVFGVSFSAAFNANEDVIFKLYKRDNPTSFTVLRISQERTMSNDTLFDPELPTRIHVHGFLAKEEIIDRYRQVYLSVGNYNFIVVDWLEGAFTLNYFMAKRRVKDVREL